MRLTKEQQLSLKRLSERITDRPPESYLSMRRRVVYSFGGDCVMIHWGNMWLGIEKDGYTHS